MPLAADPGPCANEASSSWSVEPAGATGCLVCPAIRRIVSIIATTEAGVVDDAIDQLAVVEHYGVVMGDEEDLLAARGAGPSGDVVATCRRGRSPANSSIA